MCRQAGACTGLNRLARRLVHIQAAFWEYVSIALICARDNLQSAIALEESSNEREPTKS